MLEHRAIQTALSGHGRRRSHRPGQGSAAETREALTVFYDELDLAPFKLKIKHGGGAAGHNGIRSIDAHLGPDWRRVRIGIGHPGHKDRVTGHVLGNFAKVEMDPLADLLGVLAAELPTLLAGDEPRYLSDIALRLQP